MRILIGWENGAPKELLYDVLTVGRALVAKGHDIFFVVGDPITLVEFAGNWEPAEVYQAPGTSRTARLLAGSGEMGGFNDIIAAAGFGDRRTLQVLAGMWSRQLEFLRPDVIVGFCSPVLWLVGPIHAKTFAAGNGYTLPPLFGDSFPQMSAQATPLVSDQTMIANINAVQARLGGSPIIGLTDVMRQCTPLHYGLSFLDPYLPLRGTGSLGILGETPTGPRVPPSKQKIVAFLDIECPNIESLLLALAELETISIDVYMPGATGSMRQFLRQHPMLRLSDQYTALLNAITEASAVIHHGIHGIAERCLSLGRPQLIVPWTREQRVLDATLEWMGVRWSKAHSVSLAEFRGTINAFLKDSVPTIQAQHHARNLSKSDATGALRTIVGKIEGESRAATPESRLEQIS